MTQYPKRLIEVDLPIKKISAHARREKSIRHGHISTLHIWWARRPLAACRAVICAALWPDPVDPLCPQEFRNRAANLITEFANKAAKDKDLAAHCSTDIWNKWQVLAKPENALDANNLHHLNILRNSLLDFIADFANWDNSTQQDYLETSRALTQAAHEALGGIEGTKPLVVDPFAGGGSIPLEALRVGADAFASDLNPVAVLLNKVVLEYIPKYGHKLPDEVRKWGQWVKDEAEKELAEFYPKDPDGSTPIAYLWARTITCEGPGCGAEVPLIRSLWLAKKSNRSVALQIISQPKEKRVDFEIIENVKSRDVGDGTVKRGACTCPICGYTTPVTSIRRQLSKQQGGVANARLFCVVTIHKPSKKVSYRIPNEVDIKVVQYAAEKLRKQQELHKGLLSLVPKETIPIMSGVFNAPIYGHNTWASLFNPRQLLLISTYADIIKRLPVENAQEPLEKILQTLLALTASKLMIYCSSLCVWRTVRTCVSQTFGRQALPMVWDFGEMNPFAGSAGDFGEGIEFLIKLIESVASGINHLGQAEEADAVASSLPSDSVDIIFTDPPYYNAVPYADLSDFFYVWLRRMLADTHPTLFKNSLTPKENEICEMAGWDSIRYSHKNGKWFENGMAKAMAEGCRVLKSNGVGIVVFAHKGTDSWEAQLQAMIDSGLVITGSWPIDTERSGRLRAYESATLASSIHLICRTRQSFEELSSQSAIGDWRDVLQELPQRIHEWMPRLASEGVVGADAIFACLGPALEVFSRYSRVEKASGEQVTLKDYLEYVWAAVSKEALSMIFTDADATGFEEDARITAMWLWTLSAGTTDTTSDSSEPESEAEDDEETSSKSTKTSGYVLEFDAARKIAQGLGAHLENLRTLIQVKGDQARLLPVSERAPYLFGKDQGKAPTKRKKKEKEVQQLTLFTLSGSDEEESTDWGETAVEKLGNTVLDRIHQSMILFAAGRSEALKRFLVEDGVGADQRFWKLAQALSALYPNGTDEKRWVDGVLARKKGLGF